MAFSDTVYFNSFMSLKMWETRLIQLSGFYGASAFLSFGATESPTVRKTGTDYLIPPTISVQETMPIREWLTLTRYLQLLYGTQAEFTPNINVGPLTPYLDTGGGVIFTNTIMRDNRVMRNSLRMTDRG